MLSTMQDGDLSLGRLVRYGTTVHSRGEAATWTGTGARRQSYAELGRAAAQLAHGLRALGITGDERVATFMWNNNEHLTAYLAVPAMGAVLHTLNIRLFADQLGFIANHADDRVVLVDGSLLPTFAAVLPQLTTVRHTVVVNGDAAALDAPPGVEVHSYEAVTSGRPEEFAWPAIDERSAAAMCYTSGTTGQPKGVAYSHRSIWLHSLGVCMTDNLRLEPSDRYLAIVPMFHAMSWGLPYAALMVGASLVLPDRHLQAEPIARMLAAERPTASAAVPTIWRDLAAYLERHPQDISHLREVVVGGSACPPSLMRTFEEVHGVRMLAAWGMTETSPVGTVARPPGRAVGEQAWAYRDTQGRFPAAVAARLVDENGGVVAWDGQTVGELEVAGPWITGAYYTPDPAHHVDAERFDDGWLRTGDVGHITADGFLTLTDRAKDVIKSGGEWISSVELENAVMGHPAVAEAAAIGVPDETWQERPLVAVVLRAGGSATPAELRDYLADHLARWQLPENWSFLDEVPKTSVGKFDKKRLRALHAEGRLPVQRVAASPGRPVSSS